MQLAAVFGRSKRRIHCKPRVADVLPVNDGSMSGGDLSYALRAHFDFVVTGTDGLAELAVEFDGPRHHTDHAQIRRDERKARICETYMLPILRVGAAAFRPADRRTLLEWVLQVCLAYQRLRAEWAEVSEVEEQNEDWDGDLPEAQLDDFNYRTYGALRDGDDPRRVIVAPIDAFHDARKRLGQAVFIDGYSYEGWQGREHDGRTVGHVALEVGDSAWLLGSARVDLRGVYRWIGGLCPPLVAQDIALLDLMRQLDEWDRRETHAMSWEGLMAAVAGCEQMMLVRMEIPAKHELVDRVLRSLRRRGVDTDDPVLQARVYLRLMEDAQDGPGPDF